MYVYTYCVYIYIYIYIYREREREREIFAYIVKITELSNYRTNYLCVCVCDNFRVRYVTFAGREDLTGLWGSRLLG